MKSIEEILLHFDEYKDEFDNRFAKRFIDFLTVEQMKKIGIELKDEYVADWKPRDWNEEDVLKQLHDDVNFGWEKACYGRGISSSLMYDVCSKWCKVLENGISWDDGDYYDYGKPLFKEIANHYGWELEDYE